ncbi:hypothetical protein EYF80_039706 [Liparis tanakae]|uniref:Uncharacterized protein n=1 Tax=Liparis tanakae TaxID=230148 RepID=A0A4Z2GA54_9TELE|nr:hypothetical protein EYF80_039706 [Liparis tanakae]
MMIVDLRKVPVTPELGNEIRKQASRGAQAFWESSSSLVFVRKPANRYVALPPPTGYIREQAY